MCEADGRIDEKWEGWNGRFTKKEAGLSLFGGSQRKTQPGLRQKFWLTEPLIGESGHLQTVRYGIIQFAGGDWLGQYGVRAQTIRQQLQMIGNAGRHDDDWQFLVPIVRLDDLHQSQAIHHGHVNVGDHQIDRRFLKLGQRFFAVQGSNYFVVVSRKHDAK